MLLELTVYIVLPPLRSRDPVCKVRGNDNWGAKGKLEKTGGMLETPKSLFAFKKRTHFCNEFMQSVMAQDLEFILRAHTLTP